jgi:hypothetical protein
MADVSQDSKSTKIKPAHGANANGSSLCEGLALARQDPYGPSKWIWPGLSHRGPCAHRSSRLRTLLRYDASSPDGPDNFQQVIHEGGHLADLSLHDRAGLLLDRIILRLEPQNVYRILDGREWIAKFVKQYRQELVLATVQIRRLGSFSTCGPTRKCSSERLLLL